MKTYWLIADINADLSTQFIELYSTLEDAEEAINDLEPLEACDERIFKVEVSLA